MGTLKAPFVKEALLYKEEGEGLRCFTCERRCSISLGKRGGVGPEKTERAGYLP